MDKKTDFESIDESIAFLRQMASKANDPRLKALCHDVLGDDGKKIYETYMDKVVVRLGEMAVVAEKLWKAASNELTAAEEAGFQRALIQDSDDNPYIKFIRLFGMHGIKEMIGVIQQTQYELEAARSKRLPDYRTANKKEEIFDAFLELNKEVQEAEVYADKNALNLAAKNLTRGDYERQSALERLEDAIKNLDNQRDLLQAATIDMDYDNCGMGQLNEMLEEMQQEALKRSKENRKT